MAVPHFEKVQRSRSVDADATIARDIGPSNITFTVVVLGVSRCHCLFVLLAAARTEAVQFQGPELGQAKRLVVDHSCYRSQLLLIQRLA